jgi:hypothetical protein
LRHEITVENNGMCLVVTTHGVADIPGIFAFLDDIVSHPQWVPGMQILVDHRDLNLNKIAQDGIREVSRYFANLSLNLGNGKIAFVLNRDIDFGIARAWELMTADDVEISIYMFRSIEDARTWLDE